MKILLNIDDTALISKDRSKTWSEHPKLKELIQNYSVFRFSRNPDIANYAAQWKTKGYIPKCSDSIPKANVLINND
ncbi:MAG: hypothetical protein NTX65_14925 [Ignavibacteriales bacterium]|nr:hypothetical protein [Ignavibacteriales bacterium]